MDLSAHLRTVLRRKWPILFATLAVAVAVYAWRSQIAPTYRASALVNVVSSQSLRGETPNEDDTVFLSESYAALATTTPVAARAVELLDGELTARQAQRRVDVERAEGSYLAVSATGPDRGDAATLSDAFAAALIAEVSAQQAEQTAQQIEPVLAQVTAVERQLATLSTNDPRRTALELQYQALVQSATETQVRPVDRVLLVTPARADPSPIDPRPRRDALLALIVALILNSELAVLLAAFGGRFAGDEAAEEVAAATGVRVIGEIPHGTDEHDPPVVEAFRSLRTSLLFLDSATGLSSIAIVGGQRGSGKSFVAINLCRSLATLERDVVLIDGDLHNPALHEHFGVPRVPGLTDALSPPFSFSAPLGLPGEHGLDLVAAGSPVADPAGILAGSSFRRLLQRLQPALAVVDTPPLTLFADGAAIALNCAATLLVVDVGAARRRDVARMITMLRRVGVEPAGIILNRVRGERAHSYHTYRDRKRPRRSTSPTTADEWLPESPTVAANRGRAATWKTGGLRQKSRAKQGGGRRGNRGTPPHRR